MITSTASPSNELAFARPVHLYHLRSRGQALRRLLAESGMTHEKISELIRHRVSGRCAECNFMLNGAELNAVFNEIESDNPKIRRLQVGSCGRKDCGSYFYDLRFEHADGIDWADLWQRAEAGQEVFKPERVEPSGKLRDLLRAWTRSCSNRQKLVAAGILVAAILFLYFRFRTPSWSSGPSPFQVDTGTTYRVAPY